MDQYPAETVEAVLRFVREEIERLPPSQINWKITLNGSGKSVRGVVETFRDLSKRTEQVQESH